MVLLNCLTQLRNALYVLGNIREICTHAVIQIANIAKAVNSEIC